MTDTPNASPADFIATIDALESELAEHDRRAREIRETLATVRRRLTSSPGARAGKNARSGRRRKAAIEVTDLRRAPVDARGGGRVPVTVAE